MTTQAPSAAAPPAVKPTLKRSASTASLPTPPRTQRRLRSRTKRALLHGTDSDIGEDTDVEEDIGRNKKRRLEVVSENDKDAEDAFWSAAPDDSDVGLSSPAATPKRKSKVASTSAKSPTTETESPVPMLLRRRKAEASDSALLSPPPSHRKSGTVRKTQKKKKAVGMLPVIAEDKDPFADESKSKNTPFTFRPPNSDSSNNPFLDSPEASGTDVVVKTESKPRSRGKGVRAELPVLTMVTRGQRRAVPNPYYDPETHSARPLKAESLLPIDHPDYEPDFRCPPKVLFPQAHKKAKKPEPIGLATPRKTPKRKAKIVKKSEWDSSDDEEGPSSKGNPLLMAPGPKEQDLPSFPF